MSLEANVAWIILEYRTHRISEDQVTPVPGQAHDPDPPSAWLPSSMLNAGSKKTHSLSPLTCLLGMLLPSLLRTRSGL